MNDLPGPLQQQSGTHDAGYAGRALLTLQQSSGYT